MEEIINKIIELDNIGKLKISKIKEKQENIEIYINKQLEKEEEAIDSKFLYKKKNIQEKYDIMFNQKKAELDIERDKKIEELRKKYEVAKQQILGHFLEEII